MNRKLPDVTCERAPAFREQVESELELRLRMALSPTRDRAEAEDPVQQALLACPDA